MQAHVIQATLLLEARLIVIFDELLRYLNVDSEFKKKQFNYYHGYKIFEWANIKKKSRTLETSFEIVPLIAPLPEPVRFLLFD